VPWHKSQNLTQSAKKGARYNSTVIAVDLAKDALEVAIANDSGKVPERLRLNSAQFL